MNRTNPTPNPLAVLDRAHVAFSGPQAAEIYAARAAVAELVEAARKLAADRYLSDPINADRMAPLTAALAKFPTS